MKVKPVCPFWGASGVVLFPRLKISSSTVRSEGNWVFYKKGTNQVLSLVLSLNRRKKRQETGELLRKGQKDRRTFQFKVVNTLSRIWAHIGGISAVSTIMVDVSPRTFYSWIFLKLSENAFSALRRTLIWTEWTLSHNTFSRVPSSWPFRSAVKILLGQNRIFRAAS